MRVWKSRHSHAIEGSDIACRTQIPLEIVETIIDHIRDDFDTLRACALICRTWAVLAHRIMFRSLKIVVYLDCWKPRWFFLTPSLHVSPRATAFFKLTDARPQLGSFVESITLTVHFDHWYYSTIPEMVLDLAFIHASSFWTSYLPSLCRHLTHVRQVLFPTTVTHPLVPHFPRSIKTAMSCMLHSRSLTTVNIHHGSTFSMLSECAAVENLHIGNIALSDVDWGLAWMLDSPRRIKSLTLGLRMSEYVRFLQNQQVNRLLDLGSLRSLDIQLLGLYFLDVAETIIPLTQELLRRNKGTLESFTSNLCLQTPFFDLVDASVMRNAHFKAFQSSASALRQPSQSPEAWAEWLNTTFSDSSTPVAEIDLRHLRFHIHNFERLVDFADTGNWRRLDRLLSYTRLETVNVVVSRHRMDDADEMMEHDVGVMFPIMASLGRLRVSVIDEGAARIYD